MEERAILNTYAVSGSARTKEKHLISVEKNQVHFNANLYWVYNLKLQFNYTPIALKSQEKSLFTGLLNLDKSINSRTGSVKICLT